VPFDQDLRHEELLASRKSPTRRGVNDRVHSEQFSRAEKGSADVIVRVFNCGGNAPGASTIVQRPTGRDRGPHRIARIALVSPQIRAAAGGAGPLLAWVTIEGLPEPT